MEENKLDTGISAEKDANKSANSLLTPKNIALGVLATALGVSLLIGVSYGVSKNNDGVQNKTDGSTTSNESGGGPGGLLVPGEIPKGNGAQESEEILDGKSENSKEKDAKLGKEKNHKGQS